MKLIFSILIPFIFITTSFAQNNTAKEINTDTTIHEIIDLYKKLGFSLEKIITPKANDTLFSIDCYSGKDVEVIALFNSKPISLKGVLSIYQITKAKITHEDFFFQNVTYLNAYEKYCSLIEVRMSPYANKQNCYSKIIIYDKKQPSLHPIALIVLTK